MQKKEKVKEWTVIIYMAGDNDLSEDMISALNAVRAFAGSSYVNIVALYDSNYPPVPVTLYDFSKNIGTAAGSPSTVSLKDYADAAVPREILGLTARLPGVQEPYEFDLAKEFVPIKKFVPWVLRQPRYKAKKYALILSGHSDSIIGKTLLRDDNPPNVLNLRKLARVLDACREHIPAPHRDKFDLVGFDGCLMGMLEAAYELQDVADVMVASEGNIPNSGWDYATAFAELAKSSGKIDAKEFAKSIVSGYKNFNKDFIPSGRSINISAFDLAKTETFAETINLIAGHLYKLLLINRNSKRAMQNSILREKFADIVLKSHYSSQTFMHNQAVDIMDFLYNVVSEWFYFRGQSEALFPNVITRSFDKRFSALLEKTAQLFDDYGGFVIKSCFAGAEYQFSKGISLFFPWSQMALNLLSYEYRTLKFDNRKRNWRKFFKKYVELTMRTPETQTFLEFVRGQLPAVKGQPLPPALAPNLFIDFALAKDQLGKEYIGREYIGREYIGRGIAFYAHFEQMRNFSHFRRVKVPPPPHNEVDISGCNALQVL